MVTISKSSQAQSNQPTQEPRTSGKWWALLSIGLGVLMFSVDVSIVYISLPTLVEALHTSFATIQWVSLSYMLIITVLVIGAGRLGYIARVALFGLGFGIFLSPNNSAIMGAVPQERLGIASALSSLRT